MADADEQAECRWCRMKLRGQPYYTGKPAFHPRTGKQVLTHYFGGFVCSAQCDVKIFDDMKSYGVWGSSPVVPTKLLTGDTHENSTLLEND